MAQKICVVRGMSMETLTHEAGRRRFITGKPPSGLLARGSSGATWLACAASFAGVAAMSACGAPESWVEVFGLGLPMA